MEPGGDIKEPTKIKNVSQSLAAVLPAAGLVETLKGSGPYTVFAPTDEAFAKIPKADLDALLKDVPKLKAVLMYHVFVGDASSSSGLTVDGAKVIVPDVAASNGVNRVVDTVPMPR